MNGQLVKNQTSGNDWGHGNSARMYRRQKLAPEPERRIQLSDFTHLEKQMRDYEAEFRRILDALSSLYIFTEPAAVENFLKAHRAIVPILIDGAAFLRSSFGDDAPLALEIMSDEGPSAAIYALVLWRDDPTQARCAIQNFDKTWWLNNLRKAQGRIVFDFELVQ